MSTNWRTKWQGTTRGGYELVEVWKLQNIIGYGARVQTNNGRIVTVYVDDHGNNNNLGPSGFDLLPLHAAEPVKVDAEPVKNGYAVVFDCDVKWADTPDQATEIARREIDTCREKSKRNGVWDGWDDAVEGITILKATHRATLVNPDDHYSHHKYEMRPVAAEPLVVEHHVSGGTMMMAAGYFDDLAELRRDAELAAQLADALQELQDWQNGPPLLGPKWEPGWNGAMAKSAAALKRWEERSAAVDALPDPAN